MKLQNGCGDFNKWVKLLFFFLLNQDCDRFLNHTTLEIDIKAIKLVVSDSSQKKGSA